MAAVIGNNVMLYWHRTDVDPEEDVAFACSTNCTFNVSVDQKEVTSQSSAWFREYKNDVATWNVTCDGLITLTGFSYLFMLDKQYKKSYQQMPNRHYVEEQHLHRNPHHFPKIVNKNIYLLKQLHQCNRNP